ncbi:hypothetical protein MRX96_059545 [Rhipicephalus microplus]
MDCTLRQLHTTTYEQRTTRTSADARDAHKMTIGGRRVRLVGADVVSDPTSQRIQKGNKTRLGGVVVAAWACVYFVGIQTYTTNARRQVVRSGGGSYAKGVVNCASMLQSKMRRRRACQAKSFILPPLPPETPNPTEMRPCSS